jgi:hypothetical protein
MGIFITDNDTVDVSFFVGTVDNEMLCSETEAEAKDKFKDNAFERHFISFKKMNYGTMKKVQAACMQESDGKFIFNPLRFRAERFMQSIKKWSFKDAAGNTVPISAQTIDSLSDVVANFLIDLYERKTS